MKYNRIVSLLVAAVGTLAFTASAQAQLKVGTIDMKQVFDGYYKTKDAEAKINESRAQAQKELAERLDTFNKAQEQARKLNDEAGKSELSEKAKADKVKGLNEKLQELGVMQREVQEFQQTRERQRVPCSVSSPSKVLLAAGKPRMRQKRADKCRSIT